MPKGLLLVLMQPPAELEEELNAWYDTEHVAERVSVPGFESGLRYVCLEGGPKYLALYDLERIEVLDSPEYLAVSGENFSPWTRRVTSRTRVHRAACVQLHPGDAVTGACSRLILLRFRNLDASQAGSVIAGMRANFEGRSGVSQYRVFRYELEGANHFFGVAECLVPLAEPLDTQGFGVAARHLDLTATYRTY